MSMIGFPLLLIPLAIYNIFVFLMPTVKFTSQVASVTLISGERWSATFGDALLALSIILLLFEIIKASRPGARFLTDHLLSLLVFAAAAAEFMLLAPFGTSTFFLLTVLTAVEFFAGVVIGLRNRSKVAANAVALPIRREPALSEAQPHDPKLTEFKRPEPAAAEPVSSVTSAPPASVAEPQMPLPAPSVVHANDSASAATDRKVADWNVSDLVSDGDESAKREDGAKPTNFDTPAPKP